MVPKGTAEVRRIEKTVTDVMHLGLRDDLFKHLGRTWWAFQVPAIKGDGGKRSEADPASYALGLAWTTPEPSPRSSIRSHSDSTSIWRISPKKFAENGPDKKDKPSPDIALERLPSPDRGYRLTSAGCCALGGYRR